MAQAAELGADNFILADDGGGEMHRNIKSGDEVLLHPQFAHEEGMSHVLGVQREPDRLIHRNGERTHYDVIPRWDVIRGVEAEVVAAAVVDLVGMDAAEDAVGARIAEIKRELLRLYVDFQGIRIGRRDVDGAPGARTDKRQTSKFPCRPK